MEGWAYDANKGGWRDGGNPAKPRNSYDVLRIIQPRVVFVCSPTIIVQVVQPLVDVFLTCLNYFYDNQDNIIAA